MSNLLTVSEELALRVTALDASLEVLSNETPFFATPFNSVVDAVVENAEFIYLFLTAGLDGEDEFAEDENYTDEDENYTDDADRDDAYNDECQCQDCVDDRRVEEELLDTDECDCNDCLYARGSLYDPKIQAEDDRLGE